MPITVVLAADGSNEAELAFDWYCSNLHKDGNAVIIAHAQEVSMMPTREAWDEKLNAQTKKCKEIETKYMEKLKAVGIEGQFLNESEKPGPYLVSLAERKGATYIVMGTRGLGTLRRTITGSVSDYVIHHAHCPVIVYRK